MRTDTSATAPLRGSAVGVAAAALATAAHGIGGGELPQTSSLTLLLAACSAVGVIAATVPGFARGTLPLIAALGFGQLAAHTAMTLSVHPHFTAPGPAMLGAHILATIVCALLILAAEHLFRVVTHVVHVVLTSPAAPVPIRVHRFTTTHHHGPVDALLRASISRRGPPALV